MSTCPVQLLTQQGARGPGRVLGWGSRPELSLSPTLGPSPEGQATPTSTREAEVVGLEAGVGGCEAPEALPRSLQWEPLPARLGRRPCCRMDRYRETHGQADGLQDLAVPSPSTSQRAVAACLCPVSALPRVPAHPPLGSGPGLREDSWSASQGSQREMPTQRSAPLPAGPVLGAGPEGRTCTRTRTRVRPPARPGSCHPLCSRVLRAPKDRVPGRGTHGSPHV